MIDVILFSYIDVVYVGLISNDASNVKAAGLWDLFDKIERGTASR